MRNRPLTGTLILAACLVAAGVVRPITALADGPLVLDMRVGGKCVAGHKPAGDPITVRLLRSDGSTRSTRTDTTSSLEWRVCFNVPVAGSRVRLSTTFAPVRTVRIPKLTAVANRVTNVVSGQAPAGGHLSITYHSCHPGECVPWPSRSATASSQGRYHKDLSTGSSPADIDGSDKIEVRYQNSHDDSFRRTAYAAYMEVQAPNRLRVSCQPEGTTTVKLRSAGGALRASKSFTLAKGCGGAPGSFKRNGNAVNVRVGDRITADFASDASLRWPAISVSAQLGGHLLTVHCLPQANFMVSVGPGTGTRYIGTTDIDGDFTADLTGTWTFQSGDRLDLACETIRGDRVRLVRTI